MKNLRPKRQVERDWQSFLRDCRKQTRFEREEIVEQRKRRRRNYAMATQILGARR